MSRGWRLTSNPVELRCSSSRNVPGLSLRLSWPRRAPSRSYFTSGTERRWVVCTVVIAASKCTPWKCKVNGDSLAGRSHDHYAMGPKPSGMAPRLKGPVLGTNNQQPFWIGGTPRNGKFTVPSATNTVLNAPAGRLLRRSRQLLSPIHWVPIHEIQRGRRKGENLGVIGELRRVWVKPKERRRSRAADKNPKKLDDVPASTA